MKTIKLSELGQHQPRITHLQGEANYTFVYFVDQPRLLLSSTLCACQDNLPGFIRIHRKYAVNPAFVSGIQTRLGNPHITIQTHCLPVSRRLLNSVRQALASLEVIILHAKPAKSIAVQITHEAYRNIRLTWE